MKARINFLDNLRTIMIFLVVVLHAGIVYEPILENIWIVSDPAKNSSLGLMRMYLDLFIMFTIFFISGYFVYQSVKSKTTWQFLTSKFNRIMVPWMVAVLVLIPLYKIIFLYSRELPQEVWYSYFHIFERSGEDLGFFANNPSQSWLWFLPVLFLFQVIYVLLKKAGLLNLNISFKSAVVLVFVAGLSYSMIISGLNLSGWYHSALLHFQTERFFVYLSVFLLGSLCNKLNIFHGTSRNKKEYIVMNVVLSVSLAVFTTVALNLFFNMIDPGREYYFVSPIVDRLGYYSTMLISMLGFLYVFIYNFRFYFNKTNRLMNSLNKNSYAVYIIHIVVIGAIAWPMMALNTPVMVKFLLLSVLSFVVSNVIINAGRLIWNPMMSSKVANVGIVSASVLVAIMVYYNMYQSCEQISVKTIPVEDVESTPAKSIHAAAVEGDLETIQQYIGAGSDLDEAEPTNGSSPLITAIVFGKTEVALALIEAGADINYQNKEGSTPLHTSAFFCRTEIVKILLENNADVTIKNNSGSTALDSVTPPFEVVKGIYDYFQNTLGPLGLELDYQEIIKTRPRIASMLENK